MNDYHRRRRLERAVYAAARACGLKGDPFADVPDCGAFPEQLSAVDLYHRVYRPVRDGMEHECWEMCRRVALSSARESA